MVHLGDDKIMQLFFYLNDLLKETDLSSVSAPEIAMKFYGKLRELSGVEDPFAGEKEKQNKTAFELLDILRDHIHGSNDEFSTAMRISAAGNIIDLGAVKNIGDIKIRIMDIIHTENELWQSDILRKRIEQSKDILILGDNAGEIVFDRLLLEVLSSLYPSKELIYAVRGEPVINDATRIDAEFAGISDYAHVIDTGSSAPGILLSESSDEFCSAFWGSDVVISKGQGNFETLNDVKREVFFVLSVKCECVGDFLGVSVGSAILKRHE